MTIEVIPLVSFVLITTFTPGPNNISSASMGILYGYRETLTYLVGIASGFFVVMIACAHLSGVVLAVMPSAQQYLRWLGAGYIVWLAIGICKSSHSITEPDKTAKAFTKGFLLQLFNPKVAVFGLTLYSTFLAPISARVAYLFLTAVLFALTAFVATSTWALFGAAIKQQLSNDRFRKTINLILSLLLVYTAAELSGMLP